MVISRVSSSKYRSFFNVFSFICSCNPLINHALTAFIGWGRGSVTTGPAPGDSLTNQIITTDYQWVIPVRKAKGFTIL